MSRRKSISTKQIKADHWDNNEIVVIRSLNTDDEENITDSLAGIDASGQPRMYAGRNKRLTLQRGIVSWTFTDEQGVPLPLSELSIRGLAPVDSQFIYDQIQALNAPLTDAEKNASSTSATDSTATVA
jgi:hypothetical protein